MREVARAVACVCLPGLVLTGLVGCGQDTEAYCDAVRESGSVEILSGSEVDEVQDRLAEIVELAPEEIAPLWEDFANGYADLVNTATDMEEVDELSSELEETAEEIERDYQSRCGD